jgi:WD40 repeat protein
MLMGRSRRVFATIYPFVAALILAGCTMSSAPPTAPPISAAGTAPVAPPSPTAAPLAPTALAPTAAPLAPTATPAPPAAADFSPPTATPALSSQLITADTLAALRPLRTIGYGQAKAAAIDPGNTLLAVGTTAGVAWFELPGLRALRFDKIAGGVDSLAFQYGDQLVVAGPGGQRQLRVATGEPQPPANQEDMGWLGGANPISSPDGTLIATSLGDRQSALWSAGERKLLRTLKGTAPVFSPDGQMIATTLDGDSIVWRAGEDHELLSVAGTGPAFSPDGQALRTGGERDVRLWRLPGGGPLGHLDTDDPRWQAEFSADSRELRVIVHVQVEAQDETEETIWLKVVNVADGRLLRDAALAKDQAGFEEINGTLGPHGNLAVVVGYKGQVTRAADGKPLFTSDENDATTYQLAAFSHDGELAALLNADGRVYLVSASDGSVRTLDLEGITSLAISPDGSLLATGSDNPRIWQLIDGVLTQTLELNVNESWWEGGSSIGAIAFSPDGYTLAIESDAGEAATLFHHFEGWTIGSGSASVNVWKLDHEYGPTGLLWRFSAAARAVAWLDGAGRITLKTTAGPTLTLSEDSSMRALGFSPDGSLLAAGDKSGRVALLSTADGATTATLEAGGPVGDVVFSPDGTLLGARQDDGTLTVWRLGEQTPLITLKTGALDQQTDPPGGSFIFSADKQLLIAGGKNGVTFYRLSDGSELHRLSVGVQDMAIGPAGRLLAIAQTDGQVTLWGVS